MQTKTNETPEPQQEPAESALSRCLVEGDAARKSRDRRRRGEALGISFAIESAVLALLIVVPLMTSVAQPHLNSTLYVPIAFGGSRAPSEPQHPPSAVPRCDKFRAHSFTFAMEPRKQRPAPRPGGEPGTARCPAD